MPEKMGFCDVGDRRYVLDTLGCSVHEMRIVSPEIRDKRVQNAY